MAGSTTIAAPNDGTNNPFFGALGKIADAVGSTFTEVFPVWTASQLDLQRTDQLENALFDPRYAGNTLDLRFQGQGSTQTPGPTKTGFFQLGGVEISGLSVVVGVIGVTALLLLIRRK